MNTNNNIVWQKVELRITPNKPRRPKFFDTIETILPRLEKHMYYGEYEVNHEGATHKFQGCKSAIILVPETWSMEVSSMVPGLPDLYFTITKTLINRLLRLPSAKEIQGEGTLEKSGEYHLWLDEVYNYFCRAIDEKRRRKLRALIS